jgi:hypothetical protein
MADDRIQSGILGDIRPRPEATDKGAAQPDGERDDETGNEQDESMSGGSRHDRSGHAGSRDVTEGVTGGLGTETGGTRNYRSGSGATGGDIGNRPE